MARLSRQLALWVFVSIIFIEIVILIPSTMRREREKLLELKQACYNIWIATMKLSPPDASPQELLSQFEKARPNNNILLGGAIFDRNFQNTITSFGINPSFSLDEATQAYDFFYIKNKKQYSIAWQPSDLKGDYLVIQVDASFIQKYLKQYIINIILLIALISVFTTLGTMLALSWIVLLPILKLRKDLMKAGKMTAEGKELTNINLN